MEVRFQAKYPWAVLPYKRSIEHRVALSDARLYEQNFRWLRRRRVASLCRPWRMGQEIGWVVPSPVDVEMTPLDDVEVACSMDELETFRAATGYHELWKRDETFVAVKKAAWLRLYETKFNTSWETMFVPNGEGTVEWHLGWSVSIPASHYLMVFDTSENPELEVPVGIFDSKIITRLSNDRGLSIAVRPRKKLQIRRRQSIARIALLSKESLIANGIFDEVKEPHSSS